MRERRLLAAVILLSAAVSLLSQVAFLPEFQSAAATQGYLQAFVARVAAFTYINWLEFVGVVTGLVSVFLATRSNIWVWPVGIVWCLTTAWVMFVARFYGDAILMIIYFVLQIHGWWSWSAGKGMATALPVRWATWALRAVVAGSVAVGVAAATPFLQWARGAAPFWDAFTTSGSLGAQFLMNRRYIDSWLAWIVVDIVYVPLYFSRELYGYSLQAAVFLVLAVFGWIQWSRELKTPHELGPSETLNASPQP